MAANGDHRMCYNHRTTDDEADAEDRLKHMIRNHTPSRDEPDDDDTGLIVFQMNEKDTTQTRELT